MIGMIRAGLKTSSKAFRAGTGMSAGGFATWTAINTAVNVGVEKQPLGQSLVKGAAEAVLWEYATGPMMAWTFATQGPQLGVAIAEAQRMHSNQWNQRHYHSIGGNYQDTQSAYDMRRAGSSAIQDSMTSLANSAYTSASSPATMRQSAMQAIQGSQLNGRSSLGTEARLMHRSFR